MSYDEDNNVLTSLMIPTICVSIKNTRSHALQSCHRYQEKKKLGRWHEYRFYMRLKRDVLSIYCHLLEIGPFFDLFNVKEAKFLYHRLIPPSCSWHNERGFLTISGIIQLQTFDVYILHAIAMRVFYSKVAFRWQYDRYTFYVST